MNRIVIPFFIALASFPSTAQEKWSLERCIQHAKENNLQVKQTQISQSLAKNQLTQAKADFYPNLNSDLSYGVNFGRSIDPTTYDFVTQQIQTSSVSLSSGVTLFSGLNKVNALKQSKYDVLSSQYATEDVASSISLSITSAFLQILLSNEENKKAEERLKLSAQQVEQTSKLVAAGVLPEGNLLDVQAQQAADSLAFIISKNAIELSKLNLALLLQLEEPAAFDVEIPEVTVTAPAYLNELNAENVYTTALNNQASVKSANYSVLSAERRWRAAQGLYFPSLSLYYSLRTNHSSIAKKIDAEISEQNPVIGYVDDANLTPVRSLYDFTTPVYVDAPFLGQYSDNLNHTLGLRLTVPIFNSMQTRMAVKNMELQAVKAKYSLKTVQDRLKSDVYAAYADAKAAYQKYQASKNSVSALEKSFEYVTKKFSLGAATTLEYSTASTNLAAAQSELIKSKYEYIFKLKVLDYYLGNPITLN
ncbi:MAG TPA: TolC family protein [Chitinophagales bacterium]|nr:TolC family protein [Chitinophagales bacterium]